MRTDGSSAHKYYGEYYVDRYLNFAPNAVVILNRLCYASGNSEWGSANPTKATAIKRVDNYGAGFLRTGARAVFAEGIDSASYILYGLFKTNRTMQPDLLVRPRPERRRRLRLLLGPDARASGRSWTRSPASTTARSSATWG